MFTKTPLAFALAALLLGCSSTASLPVEAAKLPPVPAEDAGLEADAAPATGSDGAVTPPTSADAGADAADPPGTDASSGDAASAPDAGDPADAADAAPPPSYVCFVDSVHVDGIAAGYALGATCQVPDSSGKNGFAYGYVTVGCAVTADCPALAAYSGKVAGTAVTCMPTSTGAPYPGHVCEIY